MVVEVSVQYLAPLQLWSFICLSCLEGMAEQTTVMSWEAEEKH